MVLIHWSLPTGASSTSLKNIAIFLEPTVSVIGDKAIVPCRQDRTQGNRNVYAPPGNGTLKANSAVVVGSELFVKGDAGHLIIPAEV